MSKFGEDLKDLRLNREERRKMAKKVHKETGKKKEDVSVSDVLTSLSETRKKKNRRK